MKTHGTVDLSSALNGVQWELAHGTQFTGCWAGARSTLDIVEEIEDLASTGSRTPFVQSVPSHHGDCTFQSHHYHVIFIIRRMCVYEL
jgi:hypothetical protein